MIITRTTRLLALTLTAALVLLATACGGSDDKKAPEPKLAAGQDATTVKEVQSAFTNLAAVKTVRAEISAQQMAANGSINTTVFKYDFVPPDRYQLTSSTGGISRAVGEDLFSYANNVWTKLPDYSGADYAGFDHFFNPKFMSDLAKEIGVTATVSKGSTDTINGKTCQQYKLTVSSTGNTTDVCIADKLPLKLVYHTGKLDTTAVFSDYNADIKIDKPQVQ